MVLCGMMFSVHVLIYAVTVDTSQSVHARQSFSVSSAVSDHSDVILSTAVSASAFSLDREKLALTLYT